MSINTRPPRSVVVLGGALDAVNVILAGTSDCCNLPCRGVWNWGVAAGSAPGWPGQSARYCPKQRGWRRVAGHGVAGVRAVLQRNLAVLVIFLNLDLRFWNQILTCKKIQNTIHVSFLLDIENKINLNANLILIAA